MLIPPLSASELRIEYTTERWPKSRVLLRPGESISKVAFVTSGVVRTWTVCEDGRELVLEFLAPGDILCESVLFGDPIATVGVTTHEATVLDVVDVSAFREAVSRTPMLWSRLAGAMGDRKKQLERRIGQLTFLPVRRRLEMALLELAERFGVPDERGVLLQARFSHEILARFIAANRVSVTLAIGALEREGFIVSEGRRIRLRRSLLEPDTLLAV